MKYNNNILFIIQEEHTEMRSNKILNQTFQFYETQLKNSSVLHDYFSRNKLDSGALLRHIKLGYSNGTLVQFAKDDPELLRNLIENKLLDSEHNELLKGCLIRAIKNEKNEIVDLEGVHLNSKRTFYLTGYPKKDTLADILDTFSSIQNNIHAHVRAKYSVKHIDKKSGRLTATLKIAHPVTKRFIIDTLNLFSEKQRRTFASQVADMFGQCEADVDDELFTLIDMIESNQFSQANDQINSPSESDKNEALELLRSPKLLDNILEDFKLLGYIGEELNKTLGYLVMTSRKTKNPLSLIIMSTSAAGKSTLQKSIFELCPPEDKKYFTRMTPQSLYYLGEESLKHKFLSIEEDEGSHDAGYALKILLSAKELNISSTGQDPHTGQKRSNEIKTEGPVSVMVSTTRSEVEPELASRALIVTIDESYGQTKKIHEAQRFSRTLKGRLSKKETQRVIKKHHTIQRLLRRDITVINNKVDTIDFPIDRLKYRRGHEQLLNLIDTIAFLRQYQKTIKVHDEVGEYIEVDCSDIKLGVMLFEEVMSWVGHDLKPTTKKLLTNIEQYCNDNDRPSFTRRELRETYKWEPTNLHRQLKALVELEYVRVKRGHNGVAHMYELV